jgi:formylglycine-generating enzyme required for sulfatase activity
MLCLEMHDGRRDDNSGALKVKITVGLESRGDGPFAVAPFNEKTAKQYQAIHAKHLRVPVVQTNSIGMKMALIPPGEFMMGSPADEKDRLPVEGPQHRVRITRPFYLAIHDVTVRQFGMFVADARYKTEAERDGQGGYGYDGGQWRQKSEFNWRNTGFTQTGEHPVVNVSWNDAAAFCKWLSQKEGKTFCLPTEAQWEYACRAGTTTKYSFGDDESELKEYAWYASNGGGRTHAVGARKSNAWGLYDMHGNVWQWCDDWFGSYVASAVVDPTGPASGSDRVARGGCWRYVAGGCRSAGRAYSAPGDRFSDLGFRVSRVLAEQEAKGVEP